MCNKPNIDWTKTLEAFDPDSPGRLPRPAKLLADNYRLKSGLTCRLVLVENEDHTSIHLYHHNGTKAQPFTPELRNKTKKVTKWYNLYDDGPCSIYFDTEKEAKRNCKQSWHKFIETREVDIEVPE